MKKIVGVMFVNFFFKATTTTETYTLSLHDALAVSTASLTAGLDPLARPRDASRGVDAAGGL